LMNQSMEEYGTADSLKFSVIGRCWGKITPTSGTGLNNWRAYNCDTTCANDGNRDAEDITMTQAVHDIDGNGTLDLLLTFDHNDDLYGMYNEGSNAAATINLALNDNSYPSSSTPVVLANQPYPYFFDIDHDGDD